MANELIMVIDDDISILKMIEILLNKSGYEVNLANSGKEALATIEKGVVPDLIICDISMPDMDGITVFKEIISIRPNIPVIFLTSVDDVHTELTVLELGAVDYITKPFIPDIFLARVKNHLLYSKQTVVVAQTDTLKVKLDKEKVAKLEGILTEAELEVGKMIALGYTNQEIAEELNYSYNYVKKLAYRIYDKLNISKRHELRWFFVI